MKIAQVSPLYESVPPKVYGGTERVVSYLTEALVRLGHDVTLFASGDSFTQATLVSCSERSLRLDSTCIDPIAHHVLQLERVFQQCSEFDVVHFHVDYLHFPLTRRVGCTGVSTLHGRLDVPDLQPLYREFADMPVVSISNAQRNPIPWANWQATVYHGLPAGTYRLHLNHGNYLAFIGRISPEKRVDRAIDLAKRTGIPLKIAAKVGDADRDYYENMIKPMLRAAGTLVEFIGEITEAEKDDFLGNAYALAFLIDWPEPFGLAMIEAMACGTPVIAYPRGSVPEVVTNGLTGFIVGNQAEAAEAAAHVASFDRRACREEFERQFTDVRMASDYLNVYTKLLNRQLEPLHGRKVSYIGDRAPGT